MHRLRQRRCVAATGEWEIAMGTSGDGLQRRPRVVALVEGAVVTRSDGDGLPTLRRFAGIAYENRKICGRLKAYRIVEQFDANVNGKACLRLLDPITTGSGNEDKNSNFGKTCQVTDQFVELPIEHQIVDMIDAAGSGGITLKEFQTSNLQFEFLSNYLAELSLLEYDCISFLPSVVAASVIFLARL